MLRKTRTSVFKKDMETLIVAATFIRRFSQAEWRACLVASGGVRHLIAYLRMACEVAVLS